MSTVPEPRKPRWASRVLTALFVLWFVFGLRGCAVPEDEDDYICHGVWPYQVGRDC